MNGKRRSGGMISRWKAEFPGEYIRGQTYHSCVLEQDISLCVCGWKWET